MVRRTRFRICEMDTIMTGRRGVQEWQAVRRTALKEAMKCAGVKGDDDEVISRAGVRGDETCRSMIVRVESYAAILG